jgi:hypothetical protein
MSRFFPRLLAIVVVAVSFITLTDKAAAAGVRPYRAVGLANIVGLSVTGEGQATHLGHYVEAGNITSVLPIGPGVLAITAVVAYTTDEGYELHATAAGTLDLNTGTLAGILTYDGGTGRFVDATGSSSLVGRLQASGAFAVTVVGQINF